LWRYTDWIFDLKSNFFEGDKNAEIKYKYKTKKLLRRLMFILSFSFDILCVCWMFKKSHVSEFERCKTSVDDAFRCKIIEFDVTFHILENSVLFTEISILRLTESRVEINLFLWHFKALVFDIDLFAFYIFYLREMKKRSDMKMTRKRSSKKFWNERTNRLN
jgi:hypothetical protein